jgi:hypothetical protein
MNASVETAKTSGADADGNLLVRALRYFSGRRGLIVLTVALIGAGLALNWGWFVAAGVAPMLLALAPCAAMCALGLCMDKMGSKSCSTKSVPEIPTKSINEGGKR